MVPLPQLGSSASSPREPCMRMAATSISIFSPLAEAALACEQLDPALALVRALLEHLAALLHFTSAYSCATFACLNSGKPPIADLSVVSISSGLGPSGAKVGLCELPRALISSNEKGGTGGTCVLRGCVPKKLMALAGLFAEDVQDAASFGYHYCKLPCSLAQVNCMSDSCALSICTVHISTT